MLAKTNPSCVPILPNGFEDQAHLFENEAVLAQAATFLQLEGTGNDRIVVDGGDISNAATALSFKDGASNSAVKLRQ